MHIHAIVWICNLVCQYLVGRNSWTWRAICHSSNVLQVLQDRCRDTFVNLLKFRYAGDVGVQECQCLGSRLWDHQSHTLTISHMSYAQEAVLSAELRYHRLLNDALFWRQLGQVHGKNLRCSNIHIGKILRVDAVL